jgi:AcrR family transcriptional regulator
VTKGSFYWHFADMAAYCQALIESWAQLKDAERRDIEQMRDWRVGNWAESVATRHGLAPG